MKMNKPIQLNAMDKVKIFMASGYMILCCNKIKKTSHICGRDIGNMYKIYRTGKTMINKDLNIINMINRLRFF